VIAAVRPRYGVASVADADEGATGTAEGLALSPAEHRALLAEIAEEVRARRVSGDVPAELERELDEAFARHAPVGALDDGLPELLRQVEANAHVNTQVPTASNVPGGAQVKLLILRAIGWCLAWIAGQTTAFAGLTNRVLHVLAERITALEGSVGLPDPGTISRLAGAGPVAAGDAVAALAPLLASCPAGRVLVARGGDGALCRALIDAGHDAYLVEPDADAAFEAASVGLDARPGTAAAHLERLPSQSLAAVVLVGDVDVLPVANRLQLAGLAAAALIPGGLVAVLSADLVSWGSGATAVAADLAAAPPWRPATWAAVLADTGLLALPPTALPAGHLVMARASIPAQDRAGPGTP
jgi:hypothetical protein